VPFCACENVIEARENIDDWRAIPVEIRCNLCLFVPTKSSAIARKFLKRLGLNKNLDKCAYYATF